MQTNKLLMMYDIVKMWSTWNALKKYNVSSNLSSILA